jgi:hypothetical protein
MNKTFAAAVLAATLLTFGAAKPDGISGVRPGATLLSRVTVINRTNKCAWITIYTSTTLDTTWHKLSSPDASRPQWLRPGETRISPVNDEQVKVLAEVKEHADCTGGTIRETYDIRKVGHQNVANRTAILMPSAEGYNLWFQ